ncbi:septal ring lytic transglycosylase RlpA family protein [Flammeovirgaceae bacterium SG7u.111]|nr:septal ring lytic transglycosylase RlpA family protein [Flammeovirgaceae bacterium SG7u.132]WPO38462.1 septal ring lytic transglycosylase RlpA family protein [Flammeovirgaceae bacterium SG7u.111]
MKKSVLFILVFVMSVGMSFAQKYKVGYKQKGQASYYASKFHGKKTASGETYNMYAMTAAHRKLPFNSIIKVTNKKNGKWVTLRVNDRGPFTQKRVLDVSKKAALKLDMVKDGVIDIEIELLKVGGEEDTPEEVAVDEKKSRKERKAEKKAEKENKKDKKEEATVATGVAAAGGVAGAATDKEKKSKTPEAKPVKTTPVKKEPAIPLNQRFEKVGTYSVWGTKTTPKGYAIQIGAFSTIEKAIEVGREATNLGLDEVYVQTGWANGKKTYRLLYGSEADADDMKDQLNKVKKKGFYKAFVKEHYK